MKYHLVYVFIFLAPGYNDSLCIRSFQIWTFNISIIHFALFRLIFLFCCFLLFLNYFPLIIFTN